MVGFILVVNFIVSFFFSVGRAFLSSHQTLGTSTIIFDTVFAQRPLSRANQYRPPKATKFHNTAICYLTKPWVGFACSKKEPNGASRTTTSVTT